MRLAISNIAWDPTEDIAVTELLQRYHIDAIDIAPGKYFPVPEMASDRDIALVRQQWSERGIEITGMQALLFGTTGLNLFGSVEVRRAMIQHLTAICRIGSGLGATRLVFGSPRNRDRSGIDDRLTMDIALSFFHELADIAASYEVILCLEPNPSSYGANFMMTSAETAQVVRAIDRPSIRMQLDTGAIAMNDENPFEILQANAGVIGHIHASEPNLLPLGDGDTDHEAMAKAIALYLPQHIVSIEMLATKTESHIKSIERALMNASQHYRPIHSEGAK